jgi:hypothetical protein
LETVDIYIPTITNHSHMLKAALGSARFQSYPNTRIVLWIEDTNDEMEEVLKKYWFAPFEVGFSNKENENFSIQYCINGVLVRNMKGRTGNASTAREWYFSWTDKSSYVKMLDSDDILFPQAVEVMMRYMDGTIDGVFCPLIPIGSHRLGTVIDSDFRRGVCGSGSMLLSKKFIDRVREMGWRWPNVIDHDTAFFRFLENKLDMFRFVTTKENALYLYLKN